MVGPYTFVRMEIAGNFYEALRIRDLALLWEALLRISVQGRDGRKAMGINAIGAREQ